MKRGQINLETIFKFRTLALTIVEHVCAYLVTVRGKLWQLQISLPGST